MANIILDYDGTIHDCAAIYIPAFHVGYKHLTDNDLAPHRNFSDSEITQYLGYSVKDMWDTFMPELADEHKKTCAGIIGNHMRILTEKGYSKLYDGAENMLKKLKNNGHRLIFLSNCTRDYMNLHRENHQLDRFFDAFYCTEDFGFKPKYEIFPFINQKYDDEFIVVGDRFLDIEIARQHSLKSVGCVYGYGKNEELDNADVIVSSVNEIPEAIYGLT